MLLEEFFAKHGMQPDHIEAAADGFIREAKEGLAGRHSSLAMLPSYIQPDGELIVGKKIIGIDAGGTNLRIGMVSISPEGEWIIEEEQRYPMPGTKSHLTALQFFDLMAEYLEPFAKQSDTIGFCFSFPCEIMPDMDGRILLFDKEVEIEGAEGMLLGEELNMALNRRGVKGSWKVVVLNDTVANLMESLPEGRKYGCRDFIGLILGTGFNICYTEKRRNILKDSALSAASGRICVNMESGGYNGCTMTDYEKVVDDASEAPGEHQLEKKLSGVYQGPLILALLKKAAEDGMFGSDTAEGINALASLTAADADAFMRDTEAEGLLSGCIRKEDRQTAFEIMDAYYNRAAALTAITIAGVMELADQGRTAAEPVCIAADGSVLYRSLMFMPKFEAWLDKIVCEKYGRHYVIVRGLDGNLRGAAAAAMIGSR